MKTNRNGKIARLPRTLRDMKSPGAACPSPTGVGEGGPAAAAEGPDEGRQGKTF